MGVGLVVGMKEVHDSTGDDSMADDSSDDGHYEDNPMDDAHAHGVSKGVLTVELL